MNLNAIASTLLCKILADSGTNAIAIDDTSFSIKALHPVVVDLSTSLVISYEAYGSKHTIHNSSYDIVHAKVTSLASLASAINGAVKMINAGVIPVIEQEADVFSDAPLLKAESTSVLELVAEELISEYEFSKEQVAELIFDITHKFACGSADTTIANICAAFPQLTWFDLREGVTNKVKDRFPLPEVPLSRFIFLDAYDDSISEDEIIQTLDDAGEYGNKIDFDQPAYSLMMAVDAQATGGITHASRNYRDYFAQVERSFVGEDSGALGDRAREVSAVILMNKLLAEDSAAAHEVDELALLQGRTNYGRLEAVNAEQLHNASLCVDETMYLEGNLLSVPAPNQIVLNPALAPLQHYLYRNEVRATLIPLSSLFSFKTQKEFDFYVLLTIRLCPNTKRPRLGLSMVTFRKTKECSIDEPFVVCDSRTMLVLCTGIGSPDVDDMDAQYDPVVRNSMHGLVHVVDPTTGGYCFAHPIMEVDYQDAGRFIEDYVTQQVFASKNPAFQQRGNVRQERFRTELLHSLINHYYQ